jgi:hypothetical protein
LIRIERLLILKAVGGNTGWHNSITRHDRYAPLLSYYPGAAGGRTIPSAAGFHTAEIAFTDDSGTYIMETRDAPALTERRPDGQSPLRDLLRANANRIRKIDDHRISIPPREPYMEGHNSWVPTDPARCWCSRSETSPSTRSPTSASSPKTAIASTTTSTTARSLGCVTSRTSSTSPSHCR